MRLCLTRFLGHLSLEVREINFHLNSLLRRADLHKLALNCKALALVKNRLNIFLLLLMSIDNAFDLVVSLINDLSLIFKLSNVRLAGLSDLAQGDYSAALNVFANQQLR